MNEAVSKDWRLRASAIAGEIVFEERTTVVSKLLKCAREEISENISRTFKPRDMESTRVAACQELICAGLFIPVTFDAGGVLEFSIRAINFRVHKSVFVKDAVDLAEAFLKLQKMTDDFACIENLIVEMGEQRDGEMDIAEVFSQIGLLRFFMHGATGRLWACAIDELTENASGKNHNTTIEYFAEHELSHILDLNPSSQTMVIRWDGEDRKCKIITPDAWTPAMRSVQTSPCISHI